LVTAVSRWMFACSIGYEPRGDNAHRVIGEPVFGEETEWFGKHAQDVKEEEESESESRHWVPSSFFGNRTGLSGLHPAESIIKALADALTATGKLHSLRQRL
jgi:hypothetical protein